MDDRSRISARVAAVALIVALAIAANLAWKILHAPAPAKVIPIAPARPPG